MTTTVLPRFSPENTEYKRMMQAEALKQLEAAYDVVCVLPATSGPDYFESQHQAMHYFGFEHDQSIYDSQKAQYEGKPNWTYVYGDVFEFPEYVNQYSGNVDRVLFVPDLQCTLERCHFELTNFYKQMQNTKATQLDTFLTYCTRQQRHTFEDYYETYQWGSVLARYNWGQIGRIIPFTWKDGAPMQGRLLKVQKLSTGISTEVIRPQNQKKINKPGTWTQSRDSTSIRRDIERVSEEKQWPIQSHRKEIVQEVYERRQSRGLTTTIGTIGSRITEALQESRVMCQSELK